MLNTTQQGARVKIPPPAKTERSLDAYFVKPDGDGTSPGVIVIHEAFGLNEHISDIARRFAHEGYAALAVDLFSGGNRALCIARVMFGMLLRPIKNGTVGQLQAAVDYLQAQPGVDSKRLAVIGFCMGGSYALQLACVDGDLKAASVFYGQNPRPLEAVARACPIVGSYPDRDFTAAAGRKLDLVLDGYKIPHDIKIYEGTSHSFFNDTRGSHNPEAAADAWKRTLAFFDEQLNPAAST